MILTSNLRAYQAVPHLGLVLSSAQLRGETLTVMFPRQAGKNEISASVVSGLLLMYSDYGGSVIVCAPTLYPQATLSFERTITRLRRAGPALRHKPSIEGNTIRYGTAQATFLSGSPEANVAGHTASIMLIADEAQDLDEDWFNRQFRPMTASTGAATLLFGTPWQGDSLLEKAAARNRARDAAQTGEKFRHWLPLHHQVTWSEVGQYIPDYGRFVQQERERLGSTHPIFLSQYELMTGAAEDRLFDPAGLWMLEGPFGALDAPVAGERYGAGLDFAGEGSRGDATVLTIGRLVDGACEVVAVHSWRGQPYDAVTEDVAALANQWRFERLICDATGLGSPLTAALKRQLGRIVEPLVFSRPEKSALGFELLAAAGTNRLRIAPPQNAALRTLWDELRTCRVSREGAGQLLWRAPSGAHDDCVASLALCLRAVATLGPVRVATGHTRT